MLIIGDTIYHIKWNSGYNYGYTLYKSSLSDSSVQTLDNDAVGMIVTGDWIYFYDLYHRLHRIRTDGTGRELLDPLNTVTFNVAGDWLFYHYNGLGIPDIEIVYVGK